MKLTKIQTPSGLSFNLQLSIGELIILDHDVIKPTCNFDSQVFESVTKILGLVKEHTPQHMDEVLQTIEKAKGRSLDLLRQSFSLIEASDVPSFEAIIATQKM